MSDEDREGAPSGGGDAGSMMVAGNNPGSADAYLLLLPDDDGPRPQHEAPHGTPVPAGEDPTGPPPEDSESRPEVEPSQFA